MRVISYVTLLSCTMAIGACRKEQPAGPPSAQATPVATPASSSKKLEACSLLKREEIEAVQGSRITDEKSSEQSSSELRSSQCYYKAEQANLSVSLGVTESLSDVSGPQRLAEYWNRMFGREQEAEEEGEKRVPPQKIEGLGKDAYWIGSRVGGTLYALKNGRFIQLSLGGPDNPETKIEKTKKLAAQALDRL